MILNNLQGIFRSKWFYLFVIVLIILFTALILFSSKRKSQPLPEPQSLPSQVVEPLSQTESSPGPSPTPSAELQAAIAKQMQVDEEYSNWEQNVKDNYPWRKKLPLTSEKYYVYFDLNKKVFIGRLYPTAGDNLDQMKTDILRQLKENKGVPIETFQFEWTILAK